MAEQGKERKRRPRNYGDAVRMRLPIGAEERIQALADRAWRGLEDQLRYLVMVGLETEERRQAAADREVAAG